MSKIIRLSSTNYKRLKAVEITPDGHIVKITGSNGAGKSSVLDSITAALGGVSSKVTPKPIRDGEDSAQIVLETEDLVVTRRFTKSGSTLTVETSDGAKFPKAQAKLDDLLGKLSLDPLAFTQLSDKEQLETLLGLVELPFDPEDLAERRKALFEQRTMVGREGKAIGDVSVDPELPVEEQSATFFINRIREQEDRNREIREAQQSVEDVVSERRETAERIKELQDHLKALDKRQKDLQERVEFLGDIQPTDGLEEDLAQVETTNAAIRANNVEREKAKRQEELRDQYKQLTAEIEALDKVKADGLAAAEMPVEGLSFDDSGVTYQGVPFKQASSAEQIRVSLAMAMALNPKLRVIRIADGSLLDETNMALIADMAEKHDYQVWLEIVGKDDTGIIIEDGEVIDA